MSGGGAAGKVDFPAHIKDVHKDWMGYSGEGGDTSVDSSLIEVMNTALGTNGNPFENQSLTDPASELTEVDNKYDGFNSLVEGLETETDWQGFIDTIKTKLEEADVLEEVDVDTIMSNARSDARSGVTDAVVSAVDAINDIVVQAAVKAYERRANSTRLAAVNRFSAGMSDLNAVHSSSYMLGLALIESQHLDSVDNFHATLSAEIYRAALASHGQMYQSGVQARLQEGLTSKQIHDQLLGESSRLLTQSLFNRVRMEEAATQAIAELKRIKNTTISNYEQSEIDIDYKFAEWDLDVYTQAGNVLASPSGASAMVPLRKPLWERITGMALEATGQASGLLAGAG